MSLSCARHSRLSLCLCSFRFSSFFHENFVVTQHTSPGVFHFSKNSQGADPRNEQRVHLKATFSNWFPKRKPTENFRQTLFFLLSFLSFSSWACLCASLRLLLPLSGSWVAWVVFARCLSRLWSCLSLLVPCCFRGAFLLVDAVPKTGILFQGIPLVTYHSPRGVGSIVRVLRQVLGLRIVVRAVTSVHASYL